MLIRSKLSCLFTTLLLNPILERCESLDLHLRQSNLLKIKESDLVGSSLSDPNITAITCTPYGTRGLYFEFFFQSRTKIFND